LQQKKRQQAGETNPPSVRMVERTVGQAVAHIPAHRPAGQPPPNTIDMHLPSDGVFLSEYQTKVRQQLEYFASNSHDVNYSVQGRKKKARLGQVGIRCRHCAALSLRQRGRGAVYYPTTLSAVYQAVSVYLFFVSPKIPESL